MRILTLGLMITLAASVRADVFNMGGGQTSISLVPVGNPGNANDTTGYGSVGYNYSIDKYDVTLGQYTQFLNAVAKTDTYGLYNSYMRKRRGQDRHLRPLQQLHAHGLQHAGHPADGQSRQLQLFGHRLEPAGRELPGV